VRAASRPRPPHRPPAGPRSAALIGRRLAALAAVVLFAAAVVLFAFVAVRGFPRGLVVVGLVVAAAAASWEGLCRRGRARLALLAAGAALVLAAAGVVLTGSLVAEGLIALVLGAAAVACARRAFAVHLVLPRAARPERAIVVWNPRSGGGKAVSNNLAEEARARGIEPIELKPGDDLVQLVRDAVAAGADALAAAGGDGTQALVATIAAEHDLPFACIPAGTRNHFALDLGVDRDDVVGALQAFVDGGERRVDLAEVNGRVFVNNVSLGLYAEAVQRQGYRDAKLRTILDTVPDVLGPKPTSELRWTGQDGSQHDSAAVILVSNNPYRLGRALGSGTRPRLDGGELGIAAVAAPQESGSRAAPGRGWQQWSAPRFEVGSAQPIPVGVDGEALVLDPPLVFSSRPAALRVRIAPHHPGASPSSTMPDGLLPVLGRLLALAAGRG
jgi:diacylglycerol kinase family enzyme